MQVDKQTTDRRTRLGIVGELTIYGAAELQRTLLDSLAEADAIELDLSGVTELDTAGFQQLYLLRRESRAAGKLMLIVAHSPATRDVLELYRMDEYFDGPA